MENKKKIFSLNNQWKQQLENYKNKKKISDSIDEELVVFLLKKIFFQWFLVKEKPNHYALGYWILFFCKQKNWKKLFFVCLFVLGEIFFSLTKFIINLFFDFNFVHYRREEEKKKINFFPFIHLDNIQTQTQHIQTTNIHPSNERMDEWMKNSITRQLKVNHEELYHTHTQTESKPVNSSFHCMKFKCLWRWRWWCMIIFH